MKRWWPLPMLTALNILALIWLAGADRAVGQTIPVKRPLALHNRQDLGQTFIAPGGDLHRIEILFSFQRDANDRQVRLQVYDGDGNLRAEQAIDASVLRHAWQGFDFAPLAGVADQTIQIKLTRNAPSRSSVGVRVGPGVYYPDGYGVIDNVPDPSFDLLFRAYSATPPTPPARLERAVALAGDVAAGRPGPFGGPALLLSLGAVYAVGLAALLWFALAHGWRRR
jgi:hypothetical protein